MTSSLTLAQDSPATGRAGRVTVVGAGNVGMIAAMRLAETDLIDEVALVDIAGQRAAGVALDISHAAPLRGFKTRLRGAQSLEEAGPSDYVVITAGQARRPGMTRADLVDVNAQIAGSLATQAAAVSPEAVLVVVTNPLDEMSQHVQRASGLPASQVLGMAGVLDTARFEELAALAAGVRPDEVSALALGSHGPEMVIPLSQARIGARPITEVLGAETIAGLVDRARNSGGEIVGLLGTGSAFFSPGLSAARMVEAMITDSGELLTATVAADGHYGITGGYVGLPVRLGPRGVREIVEVELTAGELADLHLAAERIAGRLAALG